ncbi:MAG: universal stress protein [Candidatus Eremiobacteraeota bacterium]|nr:universal stress protein [Candidatus Eremiobacteraeota bacterium]
MKQTVLVPLDGSKLAERALKVAGSIATAREGAGVALLRALETPRLNAWLPAEMLPLHEHEKKVATQYLASQASLLEKQGIEVRTILAPGPGPVEAVVDECKAGRADLIVMSSHGDTGWLELFLGSNAEKIARLAPAKILVVKGEGDSPPPFKKILIPLDGSQRAETALPLALDVAPGGSASIILAGISVVFQGHAFEGDMRATVEPDLKRIQEYLDGQAEWLSSQGYQVDTVIKRGEPAEEILKLTEETETDLVLMTSHGRTGFAVWLYGSVAERILRHAPCSVLVMKES